MRCFVLRIQQTKTDMQKLLFSLIFFACAHVAVAQKTKSDKADSPLETLQKAMKGSFNSAAQAEKDTTYFNISLNMHPIWKKNDDQTKWLYVEQAMSAKPEKPYRQRIYKLTQVKPNVFESAVYELPTPEKYIGAWETKDAFDGLSPEKLIVREGCSVMLQLDNDGNYIGKTDDKACASTLRGATYATSQVSIFKDKIVSWDRGFDSGGKQVWGAEKGGYQFLKQKTEEKDPTDKNKEKSKEKNKEKKPKNK